MRACQLVLIIGCFAAFISTAIALGSLQKVDAEKSAENDESNVHTLQEVIRIKLHAADMKGGASDCIESLEFELHSISWKLKACLDEGILDVALVSIFSGVSEAWSCEAKATFTLQPQKTQNPFERRFNFFNFNKAKPERRFGGFIYWDDLVEKYMSNGTAIIDATISAKEPNHGVETTRSSIKFDMVVKHLSELSDEFSNEVTLRGIRWRVLVTRKPEHFAVFIYANEEDLGERFSWKVSASFQLMPYSDQSTYKKFVDVSFDWSTTNWGFGDYIQWSELFNPKRNLVVNDSTLLQVEISVGKPELKSKSIS